LERIAFVFFEGFWSYSEVVVDRTSLNVSRIFFEGDFFEFSALDGIGAELFQNVSGDFINASASEVAERRAVWKMHGVEELQIFVYKGSESHELAFVRSRLFHINEISNNGYFFI
jgi:hypothetical protein